MSAFEDSNRFSRENGFIESVDIRLEADHHLDQAALQPSMIPTRYMIRVLVKTCGDSNPFKLSMRSSNEGFSHRLVVVNF